MTKKTAAAHPAKTARTVTGILSVLTLVGMVTGFQQVAAEEKLATAVVPEKGVAYADATTLIIPHPVAIPKVEKPKKAATSSTPATKPSAPAKKKTTNATSAGSGG